MASQENKFLGRPQGAVVGGVWTRNPAAASSVADLRSLLSSEQSQGNAARVQNLGEFEWSSTSVLADDGILVVTPTDAPAAGRWLRRPGTIVDIAIPWTFSTADATVIYTVPTGARIALLQAFWNVAVTFTTGTSGAAGLKGGAATGATTAGDILGGASGDLVATLVSTGAYAKGTVGAKMGKPAMIFNAADTIIYNLIAGTYTAGSGTIHVIANVLANAGA